MRLPERFSIGSEAIVVPDWLAEWEFGCWRKCLSRRDDRYPRGEVWGDSMRIGKTTTVNVLECRLVEMGVQARASYEQWQDNPYLKASYLDSEEALVASQKWFVKTKINQVIRGADGVVWIQDLPPEGDLGYALANAILGRMTREGFEDYWDFCRGLDWSRAPAPDLLVYLTASDKEMVARAIAARREFEEEVEPKYYLTLKSVNRWLLAGLRQGGIAVVEVDTDNFNFAKDKGAQIRLVEIVVDKLESLGWSMAGEQGKKTT